MFLVLTGPITRASGLAKAVDALNALASTAARADEGADDQVTRDRNSSAIVFA